MVNSYAVLWWYGFSLLDSTYKKQRWCFTELDNQQEVDYVIANSKFDNSLTCPKWFDVPVPWFVEYL